MQHALGHRRATMGPATAQTCRQLVAPSEVVLHARAPARCLQHPAPRRKPVQAQQRVCLQAQQQDNGSEQQKERKWLLTRQSALYACCVLAGATLMPALPALALMAASGGSDGGSHGGGGGSGGDGTGGDGPSGRNPVAEVAAADAG